MEFFAVMKLLLSQQTHESSLHSLQALNWHLMYENLLFLQYPRV